MESRSGEFYSFEAEQVQVVTLSNRLPEDKLIWHFTKDGWYTVKLPFHFSLHHHRYVVPITINGSSESVFGDQM